MLSDLDLSDLQSELQTNMSRIGNCAFLLVFPVNPACEQRPSGGL